LSEYLLHASLPSNRHHRSSGDCLEGKREIIRSILCETIVQCTHMNRPNSSLDLILSHWAHFTVLGFVFTARRSYASAVLGIVILSVCPSVCLSRVCFVTNPKNLPAIFLYHMKT